MSTTVVSAVSRFEVRQLAGVGDPHAAAVLKAAERVGVRPTGLRSARVYLVEGVGGGLSASQEEAVLGRLLVDPAKETGVVGVDPVDPRALVLEVHPLPGVMDPVAGTVAEAVAGLLGVGAPRVTTGWRYDVQGVTGDELGRLARELANAVVDAVHTEPWEPEALPVAPAADQTLKRVAVTGLSDVELERLSREGHLFLSLDEMRAIRAHYEAIGREPTDIELETLAQTWSEHCVHKTLKSTVTYRPGEGGPALDEDVVDWAGVPNAVVNGDGSVTIGNLLKSTVASATFELMERGGASDGGTDLECLSVFVDNAGVVRFDGDLAVAVKVETHNHPSAIEPYGGSATGIGGVIRDIIGTGLGAKPVANTDVFCVAYPERWARAGEGAVGDERALPPGVIHPRKVLTRVIDGVRDYGNRMGIPTVNGAVHFDDRYIGNPLVFAGCVGVMPAGLAGSHRESDPVGKARPGDLIVALGGRTGRDGIHGATFSSAELTDTHVDEFSHAVQIGNAIEEKKVLDVVMRARDWGVARDGETERRSDGGVAGALYSAITDCGAGGFSSAVGEMGEKVGAEVHLDRVPLKYAGLRYDEVWISESQERMVLAVPAENEGALRGLCEEEGVEMAVLGEFGRFGDDGGAELVLRWEGAEVGRMSCAFLHDGVPMPVREAEWSPGSGSALAEEVGDGKAWLLAKLSEPNVASKRFIVSQYDHEVQGNTVVKPMVGAAGRGPGDGAVIQPDPDSRAGLAIACGMATGVGDPLVEGGDPYLMAIAAVDECVRNLVCVGADPSRIAILDNFCWPSCREARNMGSLVRAAVGCRDAALRYGTPFVSGKDSLNNQFRYTDPATGEEVLVEIPPTLLITGVGIVPDVDAVVGSDLKMLEGSVLVRVGGVGEDVRAVNDLVRELVSSGRALAVHDVSEGGVAVAVAEMAIGGVEGVGVELAGFDVVEGKGMYVVQLGAGQDEVGERVGVVTGTGEYVVGGEGGFSVGVDMLREAFESVFGGW